jgi:tRNA(Arg) A34 adenosine deaminase TadA
MVAASGAWLLASPTFSAATAEHARFAAEAERMKQQAIAIGDQPYGAVIVRSGEIIGYGPSRVITDGSDAHAERVALWDAQRRLGTKQLADAVIYSTSPPCSLCQRALAQAQVARMYVGPDASDAGAPRGS